MDYIEKRVKEIVVEQLGIAFKQRNKYNSEDDIFEETLPEEDVSFIDDLYIDSNEMDEIIIALEEEFDMEIPLEEVNELDSAEKLAGYIRTYNRD